MATLQPMTGKLIQFGGSLLAILALAWIALKLGLGGDRRIEGEAHLRELVEEALCGFDPVEIAIDRAGLAALARDGAGQIMLLRRHGSHFATRTLTAASSARVWNDLGKKTLEVVSGERRFGSTFIDLDDPDAWAAAVNTLASPRNA